MIRSEDLQWQRGPHLWMNEPPRSRQGVKVGDRHRSVCRAPRHGHAHVEKRPLVVHAEGAGVVVADRRRSRLDASSVAEIPDERPGGRIGSGIADHEIYGLGLISTMRCAELGKRHRASAIRNIDFDGARLKESAVRSTHRNSARPRSATELQIIVGQARLASDRDPGRSARLSQVACKRLDTHTLVRAWRDLVHTYLIDPDTHGPPMP